MRGNIEAEDQPELVGLIERERHQRRQAAPRAARAHGPQAGAANSRKACASRGVTSGNRIAADQRRDFPRARAFAPRRARRRPRRLALRQAKGVGGAVSGFDVDVGGDADLGEIDAVERAGQIRIRNINGGRRFKRRADALLARSISSAPVTTARTRRIFSHFAASASSRQSGGICGKRFEMHRSLRRG